MDDKLIILSFFFVGLCLVYFFPRYKPYDGSKLSARLEDVEASLSVSNEKQVNVEAQLSHLVPLGEISRANQEEVIRLRNWQAQTKIQTSDDIKLIAQNSVSDQLNEISARLEKFELQANDANAKLRDLTGLMDRKVDKDADEDTGAQSLAEQLKRLRAEVSQIKQHIQSTM